MTPREKTTIEALAGTFIGQWYLSAGAYQHGDRFALQAIAADHEPECWITVNLPDEPLAEGEFFAKCETMELAPRVFEALKVLGIAEPTERYVAAGFVERYAQVWKLKLRRSAGRASA